MPLRQHLRRVREASLDDFVVIIGGGRVGEEIAGEFENSVVLEPDPVMVREIQARLGPGRAIHGSGTMAKHMEAAGARRAAAIIITTHNDGMNLKCVHVAKALRAKRVLSRVMDLDNVSRFEELGVDIFNAPTGKVSTVVENILHPERRALCEFVLNERSPAVGRPMNSIQLPHNSSILSVLREDRLIVPKASREFEVGDVVIVACPVEKMSAIGETLAGTEETFNPLCRIYVPYTGRAIVKRSFEESFMLAKYAKAEVILVHLNDEATTKQAKELEQMVTLSGVNIRAVGTKDADVFRGMAAIIRREDKREEVRNLREGTRIEMVCMEPRRKGLLDGLFGTDPITMLMSAARHPIIIAGHYKPYSTILMVVDGTEMSMRALSYVSNIVSLYGSRVTVLSSTSAEVPPIIHKRIHEMLKYLKRQGRHFGAEVEMRTIEGNPTVEFIMEVKSGRYDLVILNWNCRTIKRDIVERIMEYGPRSVLLIP